MGIAPTCRGKIERLTTALGDLRLSKLCKWPNGLMTFIKAQGYKGTKVVIGGGGCYMPSKWRNGDLHPGPNGGQGTTGG